MTSLKQLKQSGFTVIELMIVVIVIGGLAWLVLITFNGIRQQNRDTERERDIKALHYLTEAYWGLKGYYPSLTEMNDRTANTGFVAVNLKGLEDGEFKDPKGTSSVLVATPARNAYSYAVTNAAGESCEADPTTCAKYTFTATLEGTINGLTTFTRQNLSN